ncbi:unnamed protein product [Rotaria magnacalcarata]|uniref:Uncharacterized protein n=1 Tax=Rotaria magnacalcarata TaxID=392030 RepID=A0A816L5H8_9BILA|nr:unnamed protein product [Rotaria magnacalcarata]CAF1652916.1 unnamed protein product [Rotaria magnacalcarata]CAF1929307.1 unnamed protein product [Rotaria magnacalcarata]CAF4036380.1 unnamed protein product [Rotaria magnacalcarata]CAF4050524.1 unnamed protein product [Rotaria magnacalcarata]
MAVLSLCFDPNKYKCIFDVIRTISTLVVSENNEEISVQQATKILQTTLCFFGYADHLLEGERLVQICMGADTTRNRFNNTEQMIEELCMKRTTQTIFDQIQT